MAIFLSQLFPIARITDMSYHTWITNSSFVLFNFYNYNYLCMCMHTWACVCYSTCEVRERLVGGGSLLPCGFHVVLGNRTQVVSLGNSVFPCWVVQPTQPSTFSSLNQHLQVMSHPYPYLHWIRRGSGSKESKRQMYNIKMAQTLSVKLTGPAEAGGSLWVPSQPGLQREF